MQIDRTKLPAWLPLLGAAALAGCQSDAAQSGFAFPPPQVAVYDVEARPVPVTREYIGRTRGSREVEIHARVTGIIKERLYEEGAPVEAGAPLFLIDPEPFQARMAAAEAELARAEARLRQAERERRRLEPLAKADAVSRREIDDARSEADLAAAEVKRAAAALDDARIRLGYTRVTAPISGITGIARKFEGALVSETSDSLLTGLVQTDPMDVHFSISENEWLAVQREQAAGRLQVPEPEALDVRIELADGALYGHGGRINYSAARIDAETGTYALRARFPNPGGTLKAGQFVRVQVSGMVRPDAVTVPQKAVQEGPHGKFVYVVGAGEDGAEVARVRPVEVGEWFSAAGRQLWVIHEGLADGDRVILDNFIKLRPDAPVAVVEPEPEGAATVAAR